MLDKFDEQCYIASIKEVTNQKIHNSCSPVHEPYKTNNENDAFFDCHAVFIFH
jgi:hypothetical protein